jgi:hypothetical protein
VSWDRGGRVDLPAYQTDTLKQNRAFKMTSPGRYPLPKSVTDITAYSQNNHMPSENLQDNVAEKGLSAQDPVSISERRLTWKIDLHLVPPLCILYLLAFLDRVNIANARLYSLEKDLGLLGNQYNICLVMFFVPYVIFEIPANLLLKKFRPSIWRMALCGVN